ncbi:metallophosphoesterase [Streptococcus sp. X16XC17]|uniref:metallophosphoesterase n=1 Tax=Streptococcus sp. X16XC17 TaxID=2316646 RepID=UPI00066FE125|nr:metallophosphoesterase [Streptococcus sp. X16XC17]
MTILLIGISLMAFLFLKREAEREQLFATVSSNDKLLSIVLATDLHYLSSDLTDKGSYFSDMVDYADGKNMYYIEEITDSFVDEMIALKPEILILSGDLTFNGEKESHLDLKRKLDRIQKKGTQIFVIPGNHDIERSSAASFFGDDFQLVATLSKKQFAELYKEFGLQQSLQKDDNSLSYIYEARKDTWLLLVDSNSDKENELSVGTLHWMEDILKQAEKKGVKVISVTHQNILVHHPNFTRGFQLNQASQLKDIFKDSPVLLNLSGHIHIQHIEKEVIPEILTTSLAVSPHQYGVIEYDGKEMSYDVQPLSIDRRAKENGAKDPKLLNFSQSSRDFMIQVAKHKAEQFIKEDTLSKKDEDLLCDTFAQVNADYFAGNTIDQEKYADGIALWSQQENKFFNSYLDVVLSANTQNQHSYSIQVP